MGGHVLELESEKRARLLAEAKEQAEALGLERGMAQGMARMAQGMTWEWPRVRSALVF